MSQSYACIIHGPISFPGSLPQNEHSKGLNNFIKELMSTEAMQRLRWIRQNGLAHFVFNTMEHSRFAHSLGVAFIARRMIDRILLNSCLGDDQDAWTWKYETIAAALLHDIGHGPFSHSLEEILRAIHPDCPKHEQFDHEAMTLRLIEGNTGVNKVLKECREDLPERVAKFFRDKKEQKHWRYRIVSSQLDADRLDYILRDAQMAGLTGAGFDLDRILQHLYVRNRDAEHLILDRKAIEALESALLVNDQLYRAVYYHRKVRAATAMMQTLLLRVADLVKDGAKDLFHRENHPLRQLMKSGSKIELSAYLNLTESHVWSLIEEWKEHSDLIINDYAKRLWYRNLHSADPIEGHDAGRKKEEEVLDQLVQSNPIKLEKANLKENYAKYYVLSDTSRRKSYKEGDSIYLGTQKKTDDKPSALEFDQSSRIVYMLREQHKIEYVIYPPSDAPQPESSSEDNDAEPLTSATTKESTTSNGKTTVSGKELAQMKEESRDRSKS
jgi:uncharacterized protein